ncbi:MAG: LamG domain-containing protein, partial [Planctomycetota bacterium]
MHGKQVCLLSCALALGLAGSVSAELAGYWNLDERVGNVIHDRSGNGNHGTIHGATWEDGYYEAALLFDGADDYVEVPNSDSLEMDAEVSVSAWINWTDAGDGWLAILANGQQNGPWENYGLFVNRAGRFVYFTLSLDGGHVTQQTPNDAIESGSWHHVAATWDGSAARVYVDGQMSLEQAQAGTLVPPGLPLRIGHRNGSAHYYNGSIDEVAVLSHALTEQEVQEAMLGFAAAELAADPSPENEATDVPRDLGLSWAPGEFADTHDVYLGTSFDDVNAADRTDPRDVLLSQGQSDTTYDLGRLEFGQTYY